MLKVYTLAKKDQNISQSFLVSAVFVFVIVFSQVPNQCSAVPGRAGAAAPPDG